MSIWLNNQKLLDENLGKIKPCKLCGYCPYGDIVEEFPLEELGGINCKILGHHCPMFYNAEDITE